jgi:hypothetical protein
MPDAKPESPAPSDARSDEGALNRVSHGYAPDGRPIAPPPVPLEKIIDDVVDNFQATARAELVMTGMPGMADHPPMKIAIGSAMGKDGKSMTLTPKRALVPGTYKVKWSASGADTHRMSSEFSFTVK